MPLPPDDGASQGGWSEPGDAGPGEVPAAEGERYEKGAVLGQGGMGVVHAARDRALGRDVAVKELPVGRVDDASARARLAREAAITSRLDHPGIVAVHDVGTHPDGRPYYTMRLVRGRTLAQVARDTADRGALLRHLLAACEAVAAAHDAGIVHRDLKPENILVGAHGETQVIDWGLAAPTPAAADRWAGLPGSAATGRVGTDAFLSPEQGRGEAPDPRHDCWSLGETIRAVLGEPLAPELATIVARCRAPMAERYADAGALAADLLAYFEGRRVAIHSYTPAELLRRAARAWRAPLLVGAVGFLAVGAAVAWGWWETGRSLERARLAERASRQQLADVWLEQAVEATRLGQRERAEGLALAVLGEREDPTARGVFASFGRAERPVRVSEGRAPACDWVRLAPGGAWSLCGTAAGVARHALGPSGAGEGSAGEGAGAEEWRVTGPFLGGDVEGDTVVLWDSAWNLLALDARTGEERGRHAREWGDWGVLAGSKVVWAAGAPLDPRGLPPSGCQGRLQAGVGDAAGRTAVLCEDGTLYLGDRAAPGRRRVDSGLTGENVGTTLALLPDGGVLLGGVRGRIVHVGADGAVVSTAATDLGVIDRIVVSRDGRHAALLGGGGRLGLWRIVPGTLIADLGEGVDDAAFGPAGLVAYAGERLVTWAIPGGAPAVVRAPAGVVDVAVAEDGRRLAIAGGAGFGALVDLVDGDLVSVTRGTRVTKAATFSRGEAWFAGMDAPFVATLAGRAVALGRPLRRLAALSDGALLGPDMDDGLYRWRDPAADPEKLAPGRRFLDMERDGDQVVLLDQAGAVLRFVGDTLTELTTVPDARAVALHGDTLAVASDDVVTVGDRRLPIPGVVPLDVAFSADGERLAIGALDGHVRVYDLAEGRLLLDLPGHRERTVAVEFLPDGDLASGSWDATARIADLSVLTRPVAELRAEVERAWGPR